MQKLKKIEVSKGIYWVEVPEAQLYILCGCPADSVKHLIKRGLIINTEKDGTSFETGPNVILLSDVMVQNGNFSNLAEFPVLQMLYRQGMMLPNHPNNTGVKPLLIGLKEQINAQMEYIYRGNYGLISKEEIIEAGTSAKMAGEIMSMKLKFAFGEIRKTEELLDSLVVENQPLEIKNKVFLHRLGLNLYEFKYQKESVVVDLNLSKNENYMSPYPLSFHNIKREYFAVVHSGQGDGWDINRPSMSSIIMFQGKVYLIDAGPNLAYCLTTLGISVNEVKGVFLTHSHDDHCAGLPALMRSDHRIQLYATPLVRASVFKKLSALLSLSEENFTDYFEINNLEFDSYNDIDGLEVKPVLSPHPVETNIFIFRAFWEGAYLSYAHLADIASMEVLEGMIRKTDSEMGISREFYDRIKMEYLTPADLKKIDIGGGLIHGKADDFLEDKSGRIILSHIASALTSRQKEIGSSAPFGIIDVLIPDCSDSMREQAFEFLRSYFPTVPKHHLRILLNNNIMNFKPGSIILKEGITGNEIYLLLTGNAEMIQSKDEVYNLLSSGEIIGEYSGLHGFPSKTTYRAVSFVQVLRIPNKVYLRFARQNKLYTKIERLHENRDFLQKTWLFGEAIAYQTQNRIAKKMKLQHYYHPDQVISNLNESSLYVVKSGSLKRFVSEDHFQVLKSGDFFGEETAIFQSKSRHKVRAKEPSSIYEIPCEVFRDIPIVLWKLFETYGKRIRSKVVVKDYSW